MISTVRIILFKRQKHFALKAFLYADAAVFHHIGMLSPAVPVFHTDTQTDIAVHRRKLQTVAEQIQKNALHVL